MRSLESWPSLTPPPPAFGRHFRNVRACLFQLNGALETQRVSTRSYKLDFIVIPRVLGSVSSE
jgi:hypothetical protein